MSESTIQDTGTQVPEKVVINGMEYDPAEASELLGKGKLAREFEQKWNSPIDSLASAYGKSQTDLQAERAERAKLSQQLEQYQAKRDQGTETAGDTEKAREAARRLGITLNEDLEKSGYIKKEDLPKYMREFYEEQEAVKKVMSQADSLEKELNGEDGRPKFNKRMVLAYAQAYGKSDLKAAYEEMYEDDLKVWKQSQVDAKKPAPFKTLKTVPGSKEFVEKKVTEDNFRDSLKEKLWGKES